MACFIVWGWWDSGRYLTSLTWRAGNGMMGGVRHEGATHLFYGITAPAGYWHVPVRDPEQVDLNRFFAPYQYNGVMESGHVKVGDGVVLFVWLGVWGWWMVRRWRVERDGMERAMGR
ncbi:hypothetical protein WKV53_14500 [Luteolibacter sp. Y139]|uniref:Uncharacterized protein n=1 Tax=Luteolibacter soli TaxID=3135280 RepID=A0ABU9AWE8_9BACT